MEKDFHYYCIAALARAAGFNINDSIIIAYASQYVDDAADSEPIIIEFDPNKELRIDPTLTSHSWLEESMRRMILFNKQSEKWNAQKRVWIPFHFLPEKRFDPKKPNLPYSYATRHGSPFAEWILQQAAGEPDPFRKLIRIGIALHTFADTWAHESFSGIDGRENDVEDINTHIPKTQKWQNEIVEAVPASGHAQAAHFPDLPYMVWDFSIAGKRIERNNAEHFLDAAKSIHARLRVIREQNSDIYTDQPFTHQDKSVNHLEWADIEKMILAQFSKPPEVFPGYLGGILSKPLFQKSLKNDLDERCKSWIKEFGSWFNAIGPDEDPDFEQGGEFTYDKESRKRQVIQPFDAPYSKKRSHVKEPMRAIIQPDVDIFGSFWFNFHKAALTQRHLVLENIP